MDLCEPWCCGDLMHQPQRNKGSLPMCTEQEKHLDSKVEDHGFGRYFGRVVRVAELRGDVEFEVRVVVDLLVPDRNQRLITTLDKRLCKYRLQDWIHFFKNILQMITVSVHVHRCVSASDLRKDKRTKISLNDHVNLKENGRSVNNQV